ESGIVAEAVELGLDARAGEREGALLRERALEEGERRLDVAAQRVDRRRVVARERIVGAEADAALEPFPRDGEQGVRFRRLAELQVRRAEPRVQLDEDPVAQRVIRPREEVDLALVEVQRICVTPLQRRKMSGAHVAAGEEQPFASREERLL